MTIHRAHVASLALGVLAITAAAVGVHAVRNPNGIQMGAAPAGSEAVAALAAGVLAVGLAANRRRSEGGLIAAGMMLAGVAIALLGYVAFVLSFNQL